VFATIRDAGCGGVHFHRVVQDTLPGRYLRKVFKIEGLGPDFYCKVFILNEF
jgi:hypothetical protein